VLLEAILGQRKQLKIILVAALIPAYAREWMARNTLQQVTGNNGHTAGSVKEKLVVHFKSLDCERRRCGSRWLSEHFSCSLASQQ
jgi:hypothetical protein